MAAAENLARAYENYSRILVMVTEVVAKGGNPTQAQVDAVVALANRSGLVRPKLTYTEDGTTFNWTEYQQFILTQALPQVRVEAQLAQGPFEVRSRGVT